MNALLNDDEKTSIMFGGSAGGGKSYTGWLWLIFSCLAYEGINTVVVRDELKKVRTEGMKSFREIARHHKLKKGKHWKFNGQDNFITLDVTGQGRFDSCTIEDASGNEYEYEPSIIWLTGVHLPEGNTEVQELGSTLYALAFMEEAGEQEFLSYDTLAHSRLGRCPKGMEYGLIPKMFITCNPSENWCKHQFYTPFIKNRLESWKMFINSTVDDNPYQTEHYKKLLDKLSPDQRKRLRDGDWEFIADDLLLCELDAISDLFYNEHVKKGQKTLISDIAMQGKDLFNVMVGNGHRYKVIKSIAKCGPKMIEKTLKVESVKHSVPRSKIVYDGNGLGEFLQDYLKDAKQFKASNSASKKSKKHKGDKSEYVNIRAEFAWALARLVNKRLIYIECDNEGMRERIIREFKCLKKVRRSDDKLQLIDKEQMKKSNDNKSTDFLDLWIMAMWFEIFKPSKVPVKSVANVSGANIWD